MTVPSLQERRPSREDATFLMNEDAGFLDALLGDGRSLLIVTALMLLASGGFAIFQAVTGQFLPHDVAYLGMTAQQLCTLHGCRIVHFMIHDRVSFGGVIVGIATMYLWLALVPLRRGESWAWWTLAISGTAGFLSFLAYLGYGYLDTWHGAATLALLPLFVAGLWQTRSLRRERVPRPKLNLGRALLLLSTFGIAAAGLTIMTVGMTSVFVPTDLEYMGVSPAELRHVNPHLIPLIAHDRAGFGGALVSCGLAMFFSVLCARPSRSLWQALAIAGLAGFGTAIGVHPVIGYMTPSHLAPAVAGALLFAVGMALTAVPRRAALRAAASGPPARSL